MVRPALGQHARQVESVTDTQRRADLVRELGQQLIASATRHPVQFGAHIEERQIRGVERTRRHVRMDHAVTVDELRDRQRVKQLDVAEPAATRS